MYFHDQTKPAMRYANNAPMPMQSNKIKVFLLQSFPFFFCMAVPRAPSYSGHFCYKVADRQPTKTCFSMAKKSGYKI